MVGDRTASEACLLNSDFFFSGWVQLHELIKTIALLYSPIQFGRSSGLISNMTETRFYRFSESGKMKVGLI